MPVECDTESLFGIGKPDRLCDSFRFRLPEVLMQIQTPHPHSFLQGAGRTTFSPRPSTASNEWLGFRNYSVLAAGLWRSETLSYFALAASRASGSGRLLRGWWARSSRGFVTMPSVSSEICRRWSGLRFAIGS